MNPVALQLAKGRPTVSTSWGAFGPGWIGGFKSEGILTLSGITFVSAPTFLAGSLVGNTDLSGVTFVKAPSFLAGSLQGGASGELGLALALEFAKGHSFALTSWGAFGAGWVIVTSGGAAVGELSGMVFNSPPTFLSGTVTLEDQVLSGQVFVSSPAFFSGTVLLEQLLLGAVFSSAPLFLAGSVALNDQTLSGVLFSSAPAFIAGAVDLADAQTLQGVLFVVAPLFLSGSLVSPLPTSGSGWGIPIGIT